MEIRKSSSQGHFIVFCIYCISSGCSTTKDHTVCHNNASFPHALPCVPTLWVEKKANAKHWFIWTDESNFGQLKQHQNLPDLCNWTWSTSKRCLTRISLLFITFQYVYSPLTSAQTWPYCIHTFISGPSRQRVRELRATAKLGRKYRYLFTHAVPPEYGSRTLN